LTFFQDFICEDNQKQAIENVIRNKIPFLLQYLMFVNINPTSQPKSGNDNFRQFFSPRFVNFRQIFINLNLGKMS